MATSHHQDIRNNGEVLPAIRSSSPGSTNMAQTNTPGSGNKTQGVTENSNLGVTLPSIHALMGRSNNSASSRVDQGHREGHGDGSYMHSPPDQHPQSHMRKRATPDYGRQTGGREASGSPPANKRRRVDVEPSSSDRNGNHSSPESMRYHQRNGHTRSHSLHQQQLQQNYAGPSDTATPRASTFARDRDGWPTVPTPTSLRLGSRPIVPPPLYNANAPTHAQSPGPGTSRFPTTPSGRGPGQPGGGAGGAGNGTPSASRFPPTPGFASRAGGGGGGAGGVRTPAILSPIPPLGPARQGQSGRGDMADKDKFMSKMSEMYDRASRATAHNIQRDCGCLSSEEVERRLRERDTEIAMLKAAVSELVKEVRALKGGARETRDGDGDVSMGPPNPTAGLAATTDMDVDSRPVQNGEVVGNVSIKHHRPTASRTQSSMSLGSTSALGSSSSLATDKGPGSAVPVPPAVPAIPKPPLAVANGKPASLTPSPPSAHSFVAKSATEAEQSPSTTNETENKET
ncbi:hypothetical protein M408DRAFT_328986 [Serendipita vermifera MAFF 305830]|uniref:Uncharacterized protein n=1 Tax=Serendipita vermifera MAFF 305830 TaxID=933852 RepID=A0A0C2WRX9_SERVB|nr:hypothetical protein M408DRAFT_328986 [Serendipita vermifera MAFF 305830]